MTFSKQIFFYQNTNARRSESGDRILQKEFFWRPFGGMVQFVFTKHPTRGNAIVMSTDLTLSPSDMIFIYSLRFKIEVMFKQAVHQIGSFLYRFWLKIMPPKKRGSGDQNLQFCSKNSSRLSPKNFALTIYLFYWDLLLMGSFSIYRSMLMKLFGKTMGHG